VTSAFGGQRSFFDTKVGRSFLAAAVLKTRAPAANSNPQVFSPYRRQNYDPGPAMLVA
jgi:hypothetical protein